MAWILAALALPVSSLLTVSAAGAVAVASDDEYEAFRRQLSSEYDEFADHVDSVYADFRAKVNAEYAEFMANPWMPVKPQLPVRPPVYKEPAPDVTPDDDDLPKPDPRPVVIEEVLPVVCPVEPPQPVSPVHPEPIAAPLPDVNLTFYGTPVSVRGIDLSEFILTRSDERAYADAWRYLAGRRTNNLIADCLKLRSELALPDWTFVTLLDRICVDLKGASGNEHTLLLGFLLNQMGYGVRFCYDTSRTLHMLFATDGVVYNRMRFKIGGRWYYAWTEPKNEVYACDFTTPGEKALSMMISSAPRLSYAPGECREITVRNHPDLKLSLTPNRNLIDLYGDYPDSAPSLSPYTKWAIHGNTPVSAEVEEQLYPSLRQAVDGLSQYEAVQLLLKVAQTFPYGYDDEIWGRDRAFWMEESWHYPLSDCEDHAVNFSHMVRDILGLDVCLVYYPGHLSTCVAFTDSGVRGDYIDYGGRRYIVCDPTYFYASVGATAPSNDNSKAVLIPLGR